MAGLSPSATSYHLRALVRYGLVEQAPSRGDGRERVWRSTVHSWQVDPGASADPETQAAEGALVDAYLAREVERVRGWLARIGDEPAEWTSGALLNESVLLVTADELKSVNAEVMRLIEPYKRRHRVAGPPEGARAVAVTYKAAVLPLVVLAPLTGRLADRVDSRTLLVGAGAGQAAICVALAYADGTALTIVLVALLACGLAVTQPTLAALLPEMVRPDDLPRATAVNQTAGSVGVLVGPALAGLLVGRFGTTVPLLVDVRATSPSSRRDFSCVPEEMLELVRSRQQPADRAWRGGCARIRWCWR